MQTVEKQDYSPEEYLKLEEAAEYKSEYIDGQIIPMVGASTNHNRLILNFSTKLNIAFDNLDYEVFIADLRLWIPQRNTYTYPDIMIIAGEVEYHANRTDTVTNPQVIIEILSPSTKEYDKNKKFQSYRTISSFQEYILVAQTSNYIEQYVKVGAKQWTFYEYNEEDEKIILQTVPFQITLADLYKRVKFDETIHNEALDN